MQAFLCSKDRTRLKRLLELLRKWVGDINKALVWSRERSSPSEHCEFDLPRTESKMGLFQSRVHGPRDYGSTITGNMNGDGNGLVGPFRNLLNLG